MLPMVQELFQNEQKKTKQNPTPTNQTANQQPSPAWPSTENICVEEENLGIGAASRKGSVRLRGGHEAAGAVTYFRREFISPVSPLWPLRESITSLSPLLFRPGKTDRYLHCWSKICTSLGATVSPEFLSEQKFFIFQNSFIFLIIS